MTSSKLIFIFFMLFLGCFSLNIKASSSSELIIKPSVCMVRQTGDTCQMKVKVMWQHNEPINACLFQNDSQITCWENVKYINTDLNITLSEDMKFTLKKNNNILASQHIKVNTALPKKYRRRLRANWSFF